MSNSESEAKSPLAVGIDLGTTYSAIAWLDDTGRPETLVNGEGDKLTPSAVLFEGDDVVVGKEAVKALATDADDVALRAKRSLGTRSFGRPLGGRDYPPEAIQAWILQKLKLDAARQIGPVTHAVVTVPAYFDEVRRKATQDAGYIAGLEVLDIINEPTAAAIAYGFREGVAERSPAKTNSAKRPERILVYDLGGGTFDVTVLEIDGANFVALATDGDVALGGNDWDDRLVDFVAEKFIAKHQKDPRQDANTAGRLWRECEDAKRTLSAREKTTIACDYRGLALRLEITRAEFQQITADLLERTAFTTKETLLASGLEWPDIDKVLLVGGSTRMPAVREMLREVTGQQPDVSISPDEAVAQGAALRAGHLLAKEADRRFHIKNVNSHSLGVVGTESSTRRERCAILIPRNTPLPVMAKRIFKTQTLNQESILVPVVEGESATPEDCISIGNVIVPTLPANLPKHTPIEVRFTYGEDGRLLVRVRIDGSEEAVRHVLERPTSLTAEELNKWRVYVSGQPAGDGG
jgi:molecular chaperone DnaK